MAGKRNPDNPKQPLQEADVIARLKSASGGGPAGLATYTGLLGRSSKEGYWLLYPTLDMSTSIEIQESDIVHSESLAPEKSPFGGLGGTRVFVRKGAQVTTTRTLSRTSQAGAGDEFDLDIRVGGQRVRPNEPCITNDLGSCLFGGAEGGGGEGGGGGGTADSCVATCGGATACEGTCANTCHTCKTHCGTCQTCKTNCGTCQTCKTNCGTCVTNCGTCQTNCGTCQTCKTDCGTCETCKACTHVTCFKTCDC